MLRKRLIGGLFFLSCLLSFGLRAEEGLPSPEQGVYRILRELEPAGVVGMVQDPKDSSLWIATASRGLVRIGRNGRRLDYTVSGGQLSCDSLASIAADSSGRVCFSNVRGQHYAYTSLSGFVPLVNVPKTEKKRGDEYLNSLPFENVTSPGIQVVTRVKVAWWMLVLAVVFFLLCAVALFLYIRERAFNRDREETLRLTDVTSFSKVSRPHQDPPSSSPSTPPVPSAREASAAPSPPLSRPSSSPALHAAPRPLVSTLPEDPSAFLERVVGIIREHYPDPDFGVEQMAAEMGITRVHLTRKIKAESNTSPSALLKEERMKRASEMLLSGESNIAVIARECGFSTQSYFSTAFRAFFGVSPSEYAQR